MHPSGTAGIDAWVTVNQLPTLSKGVVNDTLTYQEGGYVAWEYIRWVPEVPDSKKYLYNSTGTGTDGAVATASTSSIAAAKATTLWEEDTDKNSGGISYLQVRSKTDTSNVAILEFDCSSLSVTDYTDDTIVSCNLKLRTSTVTGNTNRTVHVRRIKNTFVQGTGASGNSYSDDGATWEKPTAPGGSPDWNWGGAVGGGDTNFNQDAELDYELPVSTFVMGTGSGTETVRREDTYVNVAPLFLDAIRNRSGILRLALYVPAAINTSTSTLIRITSNYGALDTDIKLEVTKATARKDYWQGWNYSQPQNMGLWAFEEQIGLPQAYPHVRFAVGVSSNTGGHASAGRVAACGYAVAKETDAGFNTTDTSIHIGANATGESMVCFRDDTFGNNFFQNIAIGDKARISRIWMENE